MRPGGSWHDLQQRCGRAGSSVGTTTSSRHATLIQRRSWPSLERHRHSATARAAARPWAVSATARASRAAPRGRSAPSSSCLVGDVVDHLAVWTRDRLQPVMPGVDICASAALVSGPAGDLGGERPLSRARPTRQVPSPSARGAAAVPPTRPSSAVWTSAGAQGAARPPVGHPRLDRPAATPGHGAWVTVDTDVPFTRQGEGPRAPGTWRAR